MKFYKSLILLMTISFFISCNTIAYKKGVQQIGSDYIPSQLNELASLVKMSNSDEDTDAIVNKWILDNPDSFPLIKDDTVTFVAYLNQKRDTVKAVSIASDFNEFDKSDFMQRLNDTQLFYKSFKIKNADGIKYNYYMHINDNVIYLSDFFNKNIVYQKDMKNIIHTQDSTRSTLHLYPKYKPETVNNKRNIYVWLPPNYNINKDINYPVLYMHDGQQIWDSDKAAGGGWKVDSTIERLINEGKMEPVIIVGIENSTNRNPEYIGYSAFYGIETPVPDLNSTKNKETLITEGKKQSNGYMNFIVNELKPMIDNNYRTKSDRVNTAIAGSSFGASVSLYIGFSNNDIFSKIGAFSLGNYKYPDKSRSNRDFYQPIPYIKDNLVKKYDNTMIYLDCGTAGVDAHFLPFAEELNKALLENGYNDSNLLYVVEEKAQHNERAWSLRFEKFITFIFGKDNMD